MDLKLKNKFIQGYANGLLFSFFLGAFEGPFQDYGNNPTKSQIRTQYFKYVGVTMLKFPLMPALFSVVCQYLEKQGYSKSVQYGTAFLVGGLYLQLVKLK